jgi:hypothetical protein
MDLSVQSTGSRRSFLLLAPPKALLSRFRGQVRTIPESHAGLMAQMQRLRGRVYLKDGAIRTSDLTPDGRFISPVDRESWHLLTVDCDERVIGCARLLAHSRSTQFSRLTVSHSAIAKAPEWAAKVSQSIEAEMERARQLNFLWLEMGGWALSDELRGTTEALLYALSTYAWSQLMGGALGISTATERNGSASILRRLGGKCLDCDGEALPPYYDENYQCQMELLRFDSRMPNPKYKSTVENLRAQMAFVPVVCAEPEPTWQGEVSTYLPIQAAGHWGTRTLIAAAGPQL